MECTNSFNMSHHLNSHMMDRKKEVNSVKSDLPTFIESISNLINVNYDMYDLDEKSIMDVIQKYLNAGVKKIKYLDACVDIQSDNLGRIVEILLNFGYSVGYYLGSGGLYNDIKIDFFKIIPDLFEVMHFTRMSDHKLTYNGPDILSSSILASSYGISDRINKYFDSEININHNGNRDEGELKIIIGCIYQYGYGFGNDSAIVDRFGCSYGLS